MRRFLLCILAMAALFAMVSCSKDGFSAEDMQIQPYIRTDGVMGLSVYVQTNASDPDSVQMALTDPSGNLGWQFKASEVEYDGTIYYGNSSISMPKGSNLPKGQWKLDIIYKDGSVVHESFDLSYGDAQKALGQYSLLDYDDVWFCEDENLTIVNIH